MPQTRNGDPCSDHPCDGCRTCRNGRCCRRDNPNYRLPELGEWDGPIYGDLGVLNDDGVMQECHCCGEWFVALGIHAYGMHNLTAREYRAIFGLRAKRKLAGGELRRRQSMVHGRRLAASLPERSTLLDLTPEQRRFQGSQPRRLEVRLDARQRQQRKAIAQRARVLDQRDAGDGFQAPAALQHQSPVLQVAYYDWLAHRQEENGPIFARAAVRVLLRELGVADAPVEQAAAAVTTQTFKTCGLTTLLARAYGSSAYAALVDVYPELQPWQMGRAPQAYWQGEAGRRHARAATRWLLARLGLSEADPEQGAQRLGRAAFRAHGLLGMLEHAYDGSISSAVWDLFPDLQPWQRRCPQGYWMDTEGRRHAREATRWLLARLGLTDAAPEQIGAQISSKTFAAHGLTAMLAEVYDDSVYRALADVVPDLQPWQMRKAPQGYWVGEHVRQHAREATRWLLRQLGLADASYDTVRARVRWQDFVDHGLRKVPRLYGTTEAALRDLFDTREPVS